jgi:hypothetical protein
LGGAKLSSPEGGEPSLMSLQNRAILTALQEKNNLQYNQPHIAIAAAIPRIGSTREPNGKSKKV